MFNSPSSAPGLVVVDQGSIKTKLATEKLCVDYLSVHAPLASGHTLGSLNYMDTIRVDNDPRWWVFGDNMVRFADLQRVSHVSSNARYFSEAYRRGLAYALFRTHADIIPGKEVFEPVVVVSVPANEFKRNKTKIEENLTGNYKVIASVEGKEKPWRFKVTLDNLNVLPEGAGTLYDYIQAEEQGLASSRFAQETVAVASWGWYTLSILIFQGGIHVSDVTDSNDAVGQSSVAEATFSRLGIEPGASIEEIDRSMRSDSLTYMGRPYPAFSAIKTEEIQSAFNQGLGWLQGKIKRSKLSVSTLIFTGGTSEMMWPHVDLENHALRELLPANIIKVKNAAREDADGAFRYFYYMMSRGI